MARFHEIDWGTLKSRLLKEYESVVHLTWARFDLPPYFLLQSSFMYFP